MIRPGLPETERDSGLQDDDGEADVAMACSKALQQESGKISNEVIRRLLHEDHAGQGFVAGSLEVAPSTRSFTLQNRRAA